MATVLLATASVHTTAAACDHLTDSLSSGDRVVVVTVDGPGLAGRDAGDAANVARTRLPTPAVEVERREGDPAVEIRAVAEAVDADRIVVGATRGDPEDAGEPPGSTTRALLAAADRPVLVLPAPAPGPP